MPDTAARPAPSPDRSARVGFLTLLTALAGFVDAIGYGALGHLFLSFMSGNSTHLGVALAGGSWRAAGLALAVVAAFVAGSAVGSALLDGPTGPRPRRTLGAAAGALALAAGLAALDRALPGLLAAAAAMGMQNALHQVVAGADIGRGFLSGNLFALGQALARLGRGAGPRRAAAQNALSWLTFVAGAAAGAVALAVVGLAVALGIAATAAAAALVGLGPTRPPQNAQLSRSDSP